MIIEPGTWRELTEKPEYRRRVAADESSRAWDSLIEYLSESLLAGTVEFADPLRDSEQVLRTMARERRFNRRVLAESFLEFMDLATQRKLRSRICPSPSGVGYVFFNAPPDATREARLAELSARCFVARSLLSSSRVIVGIGTNREPAAQGYATDAVYMEIPEWTAEHQAQAEMLKKNAGLFAAPLVSSQHIEEYPPG